MSNQCGDNDKIAIFLQGISQMKTQLDEVEADLRMPTLETMSGRILQERIDLLEKAVEKLESPPSVS